MAQLLTGSICLTDIPADKISLFEKNGKKYLNVTVWINDKEDERGNIASIQVSQSKDERESGAKKVYIGNLKQPGKATEAKAVTVKQSAKNDNDLPF